ncbi:MAG: hypothetical protein U0103_13770 [Candidatus Obscuribacterales bacterium]
MLRIVGKLRRPHRELTLGWRCKSKQFPEEGFVISIGGSISTTTEEFPGWSETLKLDDTATLINPVDFDWHADIILDTIDGIAKFRQRYSPVHIMVEGNSLSPPLPNLVEVDRIPSSRFYLLVMEQFDALINEWGTEECSAFESIRVDRGLPPGWKLYQIDSVCSDNRVRQLIPRLALPLELKLNLIGGLKPYALKRYTFFNFAPPRLDAEGADRVYCERLDTGQVFETSAVGTLEPTARSFRLCVAQGQTTVCHNIEFVEDFEWLPNTIPQTILWDGSEASGSGLPATSGALYFGPDVPPYCPSVDDSLGPTPPPEEAKAQQAPAAVASSSAWLKLALSLDLSNRSEQRAILLSKATLARLRLLIHARPKRLTLSEKFIFKCEPMKTILRQSHTEAPFPFRLNLPEKNIDQPLQSTITKDPLANDSSGLNTTNSPAPSHPVVISKLFRIEKVKTSLSLPLAQASRNRIQFPDARSLRVLHKNKHRQKSKPFTWTQEFAERHPQAPASCQGRDDLTPFFTKLSDDL